MSSSKKEAKVPPAAAAATIREQTVSSGTGAFPSNRKRSATERIKKRSRPTRAEAIEVTNDATEPFLAEGRHPSVAIASNEDQPIQEAQQSTPGAVHTSSRDNQSARRKMMKASTSRFTPEPPCEPPMRQTRRLDAGAFHHTGRKNQKDLGKMRMAAAARPDQLFEEPAPEPTDLVGGQQQQQQHMDANPKSRISLPDLNSRGVDPFTKPTRHTVPNKLLAGSAGFPSSKKKKIKRGLSREKLPSIRRAPPDSLMAPGRLRRGLSRGCSQPDGIKRETLKLARNIEGLPRGSESRRGTSRATMPPRLSSRDHGLPNDTNPSDPLGESGRSSREWTKPALTSQPVPSNASSRASSSYGANKTREKMAEEKVEEGFDDEGLQKDGSSWLMKNELDHDHENGSVGVVNNPVAESHSSSSELFQFQRTHLVEATLVEEPTVFPPNHPYREDENTIGTSVVVEAQKAKVTDLLQNKRLQCFILGLVLIIVAAVVVAQVAITRLGGGSSIGKQSNPDNDSATTSTPSILATSPNPTATPTMQGQNIFDSNTHKPTTVPTTFPSVTPDSYPTSLPSKATVTASPTEFMPASSSTMPTAGIPTTTSSTSVPGSSPTINEQTVSPTPKPSKSLVFPDDLPEYTKLPLSSSASPQGKALEWVQSHPNYDTLLPEWKKFELFALVSFYYSLNRGDEWPTVFAESNPNWLDYSIQDCEWGDLQCTPNGRIQNLHFLGLSQEDAGSNSLSGTVPPEVELLSSLESLKVERFHGGQDVDGLVPETLANLPGLSELFIRQSFGGTLPGIVLGELTNLKQLQLLSYGYTRGSIPSEILKLTSLDYLVLGELLTGTMPSELALFNSLTTVQLGRLLEGTIPSQVCDMDSLELMWLFLNKLTGSLPTEISKLSKLKQIHLYGNLLSGHIPSEIGQLTRMQVLNLKGNIIEGTLPSQIGYLTKLYDLNVSNNNLNGTIPIIDFHKLRLQWDLRLNDNSFTGNIPSELGLLRSGDTLALSNNQLTGTIPSQLGRLAFLSKLLLSGNDLEGTVPGSVCSLAESGVQVQMNCDKVVCPVGCGCDCLSGSEKPLLLAKADLLAAVEEWTDTGTSLHGPITEWDVSAIDNFDDLFLGKTDFNDNINDWSTMQVTSMQRTFQGASLFNQPLDLWNTSAVTNMDGFLFDAISFNQDISMWQVGSVAMFDNMFTFAETFNQDLCSWSRDLRAKATFNDAFIGTACPVEDDPTLLGSGFDSLCHICAVGEDQDAQ